MLQHPLLCLLLAIAFTPIIHAEPLYGCDTAPTTFCGANGRCGASGLCVCSQGWAGLSCDQEIANFKLATNRQTDGLVALYFILLILLIPAFFIGLYFLIICLQRRKHLQDVRSVANKQEQQLEMAQKPSRRPPPKIQEEQQDFFMAKAPPQREATNYNPEGPRELQERKQIQDVPKLPSIFKHQEDSSFIAKGFVEAEADANSENLSEENYDSSQGPSSRSSAIQRRIGSPDRQLSSEMNVLKEMRDAEVKHEIAKYMHVRHGGKAEEVIVDAAPPPPIQYTSERREFAAPRLSAVEEEVKLEASPAGWVQGDYLVDRVATKDFIEQGFFVTPHSNQIAEAMRSGGGGGAGSETPSQEISVPGQIPLSEDALPQNVAMYKTQTLKLSTDLMTDEEQPGDIELRLMKQRGQSEVLREERNIPEERFLEAARRSGLGASAGGLAMEPSPAKEMAASDSDEN